MRTKFGRIFHSLIMKPKLDFHCLNCFIRCINFSEIVNKVNQKYLLNYYSCFKGFCYMDNAPITLKKKLPRIFRGLFFRSK